MSSYLSSGSNSLTTGRRGFPSPTPAEQSPLHQLLGDHLRSIPNGCNYTVIQTGWYILTDPRMTRLHAMNAGHEILIPTIHQVVINPEVLAACRAVVFELLGLGFRCFIGPDRRNNTVLRVFIRLHPNVTANEEVYRAFIQRVVVADKQAKKLAAAPRWDGWSGPEPVRDVSSTDGGWSPSQPLLVSLVETEGSLSSDIP